MTMQEKFSHSLTRITTLIADIVLTVLVWYALSMALTLTASAALVEYLQFMGHELNTGGWSAPAISSNISALASIVSIFVAAYLRKRVRSHYKVRP